MDHAVWGIPHAGNGVLWRSSFLPSTAVVTPLNTGHGALVGLDYISFLLALTPPTLLLKVGFSISHCIKWLIAVNNFFVLLN